MCSPRCRSTTATTLRRERCSTRGLLALVAIFLLATAAGAETIRNPRRIAAGPPGQLVVAERSLGSIVGVDMHSLEPVWSYPLPDEGAPFGLATWGRLVFVGNTETQNVEVYRMLGSHVRNPTLRFEFNLGHAPPGEQGPIAKPIAVAVDPGERLVFALDGRAKQVKIFDRHGAAVDAFVPVDRDGVVLSPVSMAVDPERQEVLVGDYGDPSGFFRTSEPARILIYDYLGRLLFQIDGDGSTHESTQFSRVQGMATSADGRIFVAEPLGSRILVLDRASGALIAEVGSEGAEPGQLMLPLDLVLDSRTGDLFVSNNQGARRIEVFRNAGRQP